MFKRLLPERNKAQTSANGTDDPANSKTPSQNGNSVPNKAKITTVLGPGTNLAGNLQVPGGTRIEGCVEGDLVVDGALIVGEQAIITADIRAATVTVAGTVKGNVTAERVDILKTGRIYGDLITYGFSTEEGGFLRGQVYMPDGSEEHNPLDQAPVILPATGDISPATS